jgi:succinyl-diaminopimelate desuccinylase
MNAEDAVKLTKELIQIESTNPGAGEQQVAEYLKAQIEAVLPENGRLLLHAAEEGRPVLLAELEGESPEELVLICHMDTVPVADGWTKDPLSAEEEAGRIYGRGACDMKSGLAAAAAAFMSAAQKIRRSGEKPVRTLKLIGTMDEEGDMKGAETAIRLGWVHRNSLVMDTEPTDGAIQTAHKGRYWFRYTIHGKAAHASRPQDGADAIAGMAYAICGIRERIGKLEADAFLGRTTAVFGTVKGGIHPYQVPAECTVTVDIRAVPPAGHKDLVRILQEAAREAAEKTGRPLTCRIETAGARPWIPHHEDARMLQLLEAAVTKVTGRRPEIQPFPGYTDTAVIAGILQNRNTLSYGPGSLAQAHQPDEYVRIEEIERCFRVYQELLSGWLGLEQR